MPSCKWSALTWPEDYTVESISRLPQVPATNKITTDPLFFEVIKDQRDYIKEPKYCREKQCRLDVMAEEGDLWVYNHIDHIFRGNFTQRPKSRKGR